MKTKQAFNVNSQVEEEAVVTIGVEGDYIFTFEDGSFFKLPGNLDKKGVEEELLAYKTANVGQVSAEALEAENESKLANI